MADNTKGKYDQQQSTLNPTQVARVIFAAAESMGISDRRMVERITNQVIARLEKSRQPRPLPGICAGLL